VHHIRMCLVVAQPWQHFHNTANNHTSPFCLEPFFHVFPITIAIGWHKLDFRNCAIESLDWHKLDFRNCAIESLGWHKLDLRNCAIESLGWHEMNTHKKMNLHTYNQLWTAGVVCSHLKKRDPSHTYM